MKNAKENLSWLWRNAEKVLIVTFFLTFTLNIRKVFLTPYSFLNGGFNEYMTMSFSWADLLILTTIFIYTIKYALRQVINPYYGLDHERAFGKLSKNVSRLPRTIITCYCQYIKPIISKIVIVMARGETFYLFMFLAWVGLSIFWSQYRPIAAYRFLIFIEITFFAFIALKSLNQPKWLSLAFFAIILNGLFQSLLGIAQFIHNGSLGIRFLGESIVGPNIDGVAKILIDGEKHIRAYGTFQHPNILAGFLLVPLFMIISNSVQRKLALTSSRPSPCQGEGDDNSPLLYKERDGVRCDNVPHETFLGFIPRWVLFAILFITGLGFFLTFSRSAFLGFFIGLVIYFVGVAHMRPLHRISKDNFKLLISLITALIFIIILLLANTSFFSNQSLQERTLYQNVSCETILKHPLAGVGIGQFVMNEYRSHQSLESWQYQPVHNTYLLAFSELGITGLIFFLLWIFSIVKWGIGKNGNTDLLHSLLLTILYIYCIISSFLFLAFFDHYFWDIKIGTLIFVLPFVLILALAANSKKCSTKFFRLL
jgi:O-antigen ligase